MAKSNFIHLHNHTQFSLLDGAIKPPDLVDYALSMNMPAVAITDHGNMYGAVNFYRSCKDKGIKPIIGCEVYVAPESRFNKNPVKKGDVKYYHLILLARNLEGYQNLIKLVSAGFTEGYYYKPRIDNELLKQYSEGLLGMSACIQGEIPYYLLRGKTDEAEEKARFFSGLFGEGNFYIELQDNGIESQARANELLVDLAKKLSLPVVATNDCHYLKKEHEKAHEVLLCIGTKSTLNDEKRFRFQTGEFYFKSPEEMSQAFGFCPEAITNTLEVAGKCNVEFDYSKTLLPTYSTPKGMSLKEYLENLAQEGLKKRLKKVLAETKSDKEKKEIEEKYQERLKMELGVIEQQGFEGYFLIVWDFINYSKENNIPVGPGRGSAAGSLVAYTLGITDIDPLKYKLFFERFLNPERKSMPDIDVDFCQEKRERVIAYVREKYGAENVGQIITFGSMKARAVVRDVARVMEIPYAESDMIAKLIPQAVGMTLEKAREVEPRLNVLIDEKKEVKEIFDTASILEGLSRQEGIHAAGVVISPEPLTNFVPVAISKDKNDKNAKNNGKGDIVTQYPMDDIPYTGLLKMDFLGLKTLTLIDKALKLIKENRGIDIDLENIPLDESSVYRFLWKGHTVGVFQLESSGITELVRKMRPTAFEDIIALIALYRPGPLDNSMDSEYVAVKHGRKKASYEHPLLESILSETKGVILYQEQVMQISNVLSGYSLAEADILRKAMGKKKPEIMAQQKKKFVDGAINNKIDEKVAGRIFDLIEKFAGYGFNKSHSTAYALITYQTAYLKSLYPEEFMAALMTCDIDDNDKLVKHIKECRNMGIKLMPPNINFSGENFTIENGAIRYGLAGIKNVGHQAIKSILESRENDGAFKHIFDLCERADLRTMNKRVLESLIQCGALDCFNTSRRSMFEGIDRVISESQKRKDEIAVGQTNLFGIQDGSKEQDIFQKIPEVGEWNESELLTREKEALGFYYTGHPLDKYESVLGQYSDCDLSVFSKGSEEEGEDLQIDEETEEVKNGKRELKDGDVIHFGGAIRLAKTINTKKGDMMAFISVENMSGVAEVTVFSDLYQATREILNQDSLVFVKAKAQERNGGISLLAEKIVPLDRVREEFSGKLFIDIDSSDFTQEAVSNFRETLEGEEKGACEIFFRVKTKDKLRVVIKVHDKLKVKASDILLDKAENLFGNKSVSTVL